ncbi:hybrid sensor histidine kinase/response regulator [Sphaerospermopsis torques-reginae]|uniref:histidine kinase n=1 Tax=Sphaerospermopsis torques-reginae ITEP-024 TaxID=984208 RepID=A0ABX8X5T5_9CYAN|nr:response regulator [Sphaerospermopsis torques-reginae]QYX33903.1 response regulator [Sphaerospermopsis torques-reginae ITEP-024]
MQPEQQQRILGYFIEEARDHLNTIEQGLLNLQETLNDPEMINEVFRAAHSIKGGAAMLGLSSIQHTSHRLEDSFKVLKEQRVDVDQKLESLFLSVSDTLKALLDNLGSPFGLSEETANTLMTATEPLFAELNQHLEKLLQSGVGSVPTPPPKQDVVPPVSTQKPPVASQNNWSDFQSHVLQSLREMLQLFKQSSTPSSRENLQSCCQQLLKLGEKFNLPNWSKLCQSANNAIANPDNSYLTLAKIIITEIKQAQELVIQGKEAEITISQELEALELIPELELLELNWAEEQPQPITDANDTLEIQEVHTDNVLDNSTIVAPIEEFDIAVDTSIQDFDSLPEIARDDTDVNAFSLNSLFTENDEEILNFSGDITNLNGLEVGIAELNTLEDLFQGESPDFETWEQEQIPDTTINQLGTGDTQVEDSDHDLAELLSLDNNISSEEIQSPVNNLAEDFILFDETFLEENSELQNQTITAKTPPTSELPTTDIDFNLELFLPDITEDLTVSSPSAPEYDLNSFWTEMDSEPAQLNAAELEQDVAKELEESLFAGFGQTVADSQHSSNLNFYLEDFDFTENQQQEIGDSWLTSGGDDLFADLANSHSTSPTADNDQVLLPEIDSFSQQPAAMNLIAEFTVPSAQTNADLELDIELDIFAGFDDNSNDDVSLSWEKITVIQSIEDHQETTKTTINDFHLIEEKQPELLEQDVSENLGIDIDLCLDIDLPELGLEQEEITTDVFDQPPLTLPLTLEAANSQLLELESTATNTAENAVDELAELEVFNTSQNAVDELAELETTATNTSENAVDEFAELEALLDEEKLETPNPDSIPDADFAALEALLGTDIAPVAEIPQTPPKLSQPVATKAENIAASSDIPDEFKDLEELLKEVDQTINATGRNVKSNTSKVPRPATRRVREESMKIPVKQLDEMSNLVGELVVNRNTLEQDHERLRQSLDNLLIQIQHLSDVGARMQELYERSLLEASLLKSRRAREKGDNSSNDRGFASEEMDEFTEFHLLAQETIEYIVRVRESASDIDFVTEETERVARQFRQVTSQLQEGITKARMVPFAQAVERLRRGVRDNGIKYGKQVELMTEGADTLVDKMILDHLTDPLTHMLNNAISHGIETPEVRTAAGKSPVGTIKIRAFHQGNQTVIAVSDDGAGIDHEKVKQKALQKGVITPEEAKIMSRQEAYKLLFLPSFSTADEIDDIKGRGVGMNVVQNDIHEIRGTVTTDSVLGKGTTFTIRLPLTLSICKALCCISNKSRIAFPMDGVEDTIDIPVTDVQKDADGQSFIWWRETVLPFRTLQEILVFNRHIARGNVYSNTRDDDTISVVVLRSGNTMVALQIDQVLSEQEIVIKQFEGPTPKPSGVAGATVIGDGRIMPIADVLEIIDIFQGKMSKQIGGGSWQRKTASPVDNAPEVKIDPTVLIVDDSITVRELLSLTFTKAGYRVEQARDGQEAWDKLRSGLPCDIVFCDIEMPRCDGLELLSRIQKDGSLNHLPIAMLTSRGADKHKQMAVQLGASGYFTKPYLEEALLEAASRMLKGEKLVTA